MGALRARRTPGNGGSAGWTKMVPDQRFRGHFVSGSRGIGTSYIYSREPRRKQTPDAILLQMAASLH